MNREYGNPFDNTSKSDDYNFDDAVIARETLEWKRYSGAAMLRQYYERTQAIGVFVYGAATIVGLMVAGLVLGNLFVLLLALLSAGAAYVSQVAGVWAGKLGLIAALQMVSMAVSISAAIGAFALLAIGG